MFLRKNLPGCERISHQNIWHTVSGPTGLQLINPDPSHVLLKPLEFQHQQYLRRYKFESGEGGGATSCKVLWTQALGALCLRDLRSDFFTK